MISYRQMVTLLDELRSRICGYRLLRCYSSTPNHLYLQFQRGDKVEVLFLSFTAPCIHFHLKRSPPSFKKEHYHPLEALLPDATLTKIHLLQQDRILELTFDTAAGTRLLIGEFFSKRPNCYLIDRESKLLFTLHPTDRTHYTLPSIPSTKPTETPSSQTDDLASHIDVEEAFAKIYKEWSFNQEKQALTTTINKQIKKFERRKEALEKSLNEASQWEKFQHHAELLKANIDKVKRRMLSIDVWDWLENRTMTLSLDPMKTPQEQLKESFKRVKKLQASQVPLQKQLNIVKSNLEQWQDLQRKANSLTEMDELRAFQEMIPPSPQQTAHTLKTESEHQALPYKKFLSAKGVTIWVGKNSKSNDQLTFQLANGRDWWMHASGYSGSHVIIRSDKDEKPDPETLHDAMLLALYYSKARDHGEGEICCTQRKYLSKAKRSKPGTVQVSKHQNTWIRFDPIRFEEIKNRKH